MTETEPHTQPIVTIVVAPRERYGMTELALDSLCQNTDTPHELVYVAGRAPRKLRTVLRTRAAREGFQLIETPHHITPNQARNLGLARVRTPFVVFIDNDLFVTPGWLDRLLQAAEETEAWVVGPLYLEGDPSGDVIHMAGGAYELSGEFGLRTFRADHLLQRQKISELSTPLQRTRCDFVEFHCMLVRTEVFDKLGTLDEKLWNTREHLDLCLLVTEAGGSVWLEPNSTVVYMNPPPLAWSDLRFFSLRWSDEWSRASIQHFRAKHGIEPTYRQNLDDYRKRRQRILFDPVFDAVRKVAGRNVGRAVRRALRAVEPAVNRLASRAPMNI